MPTGCHVLLPWLQEAIKAHPFFEHLDWDLVLAKGLEPVRGPTLQFGTSDAVATR